MFEARLAQLEFLADSRQHLRKPSSIRQIGLDQLLAGILEIQPDDPEAQWWQAFLKWLDSLKQVARMECSEIRSISATKSWIPQAPSRLLATCYGQQQTLRDGVHTPSRMCPHPFAHYVQEPPYRNGGLENRP